MNEFELADWSARFETWFAEVDRIITARTGLGARDWPDQCYSDWFDEGQSAREAATEALECCGWYEDVGLVE